MHSEEKDQENGQAGRFNSELMTNNYRSSSQSSILNQEFLSGTVAGDFNTGGQINDSKDPATTGKFMAKGSVASKI